MAGVSVPPASEGWVGFGLRFMEMVKHKKDTGGGVGGGGTQRGGPGSRAHVGKGEESGCALTVTLVCKGRSGSSVTQNKHS